jgi:hypothetical protein
VPTIRSHVPYPDVVAPVAACVLCGEPTDIRAETPFRPDLGRVPLHLFCSAELIELYNNRHRLLPEQMRRVSRVLTAGGTN